MPREIKRSPKIRIAVPKIQGTSATPSRLGPKLPNTDEPIHAPMRPKIADTKKPPGIVPGTILSAIQAHAAATSSMIRKLIIPNEISS
jgi:hypothetical protein